MTLRSRACEPKGNLDGFLALACFSAKRRPRPSEQWFEKKVAATLSVSRKVGSFWIADQPARMAVASTVLEV
jgi:hypothetical protein